MTHPQRILIVEDDPTLLRGLSDNFQTAGFAVSTATDGMSGLAQVLAEPPALLLLDIMLPHLNGFDLCRRVRKAGLEIPILMLTAKGQEEDIVRGLELGADDYMTKPFGIKELLARVQRLLRPRGRQSSEVIAFGDSQFNREARTLDRSGQTTSLTAKEFQLLEFFLSHPHRALTRSNILDAVWGRSLIVSTRSVDRCVATLRAKLERDPSHPEFIHTIRDVGYRFELP
ncbi:Alkaline phosphatase synthesis transcriptional regulatory protein SphR [Rubripirellula tenax]|uniref:Alkaline phosphatase synthesis transcriptional regulatory protein SphR n=1 Tax=Rubripirellula tenax TaxID=2528015 RepID=A0A5C6FC67_9BACT|nr:response regulator transcription factor [Rubripirellula tenax]TWU59313.1 Alkaline phosphatase synthesis transcriptional regulatory protein SphR [Rubripirellula tenax]